MDAAYPEVPVEMLKLYHSMDRELYSILVVELERDPKVSMYTIALWIWLEQENDKLVDVVPKILKSPIELINGLADEAVSCLRCMTDPTYLFSSDASEIPLTQTLSGNQFSLMFFHENRAKASRGVSIVVEKICVKVLNDIMEIANGGKTAMMPPPFPEDPMIARFGQLGLTGESSRPVVPPEESKDKRTIFATFSRGYPVSEWELRGYFNRMFGECVESVSMQVVKPNEQSLYALIVFTSPVTVDWILRGTEKAKFSFNGKQVWVRKFIPKTRNLIN